MDPTDGPLFRPESGHLFREEIETGGSSVCLSNREDALLFDLSEVCGGLPGGPEVPGV